MLCKQHSFFSQSKLSNFCMYIINRILTFEVVGLEGRHSIFAKGVATFGICLQPFNFIVTLEKGVAAETYDTV